MVKSKNIYVKKLTTSQNKEMVHHEQKGVHIILPA
jgi:hypothetical protein